MPNDAGFRFIERALPPSLEGLTVVEVGALTSGDHDIRPVAEARRPAFFIGLDVIAGPGVDRLGTVENLSALLGVESADIVVCAEVMEHVRDWRGAIQAMKSVLRPGGQLLITTRSPGYPFHVSPFDYWRYTIDDAHLLMADMEDVVVEGDPSAPGIFIAARRPLLFQAADLSGVRLTSILTGRREAAVRDSWVWRKRLSSPRRIASFVLPHGLKARLLGTRIGSRLTR
jgi:SAM-dependent methyltransferase